MAGMTMQQEKAFLGGSLAGPSNGTRTQALFKKAAIGTKQLKKAAPVLSLDSPLHPCVALVCG